MLSEDMALTLLVQMGPSVISSRHGPGDRKRSIEVKAGLKSKRLEAPLIEVREPFQRRKDGVGRCLPKTTVAVALNQTGNFSQLNQILGCSVAFADFLKLIF